MSSRIPPLLEPYLALPTKATLLLVTSVLGASSNWLILRYLCSYLKVKGHGESQAAEADVLEGGDVGVVLVSFLRDSVFWREGAAKLGLDLDSLTKAGRFVYVDGLTGLFASEGSDARVPGRVMRSSKINDVAAVIEAALGDVKTSKKILVVDQLDLLLAATDDQVTSLALQNTLLSLRERVHSTVFTLAADSPLVQAQTTTLEREHAALALSLAHEADAVLSLRMLDTGTARDVSGVVRITTAAAATTEAREGGEKEFLYYVAGDGAVKVFERGT